MQRAKIQKLVFSLVMVGLWMAATRQVGAEEVAVVVNSDVAKIQAFMQSVISLMTGMAGLTASGFLVWGGYGYITSSGSPDGLDKAKRTVYYSIIGLAVSAGSFVLSNAVLEMANQTFTK